MGSLWRRKRQKSSNSPRPRVHYAPEFENAALFLRLDLLSTIIRHENRSNSKTQLYPGFPGSAPRWGGKKEAFRDWTMYRLYIWMLCRVALWTQMVEQTINSEVSHSTLIYTSELLLCSTICVHSATRLNIDMYPYFLFAAIHLLNLPRLSLSDLVAQSAE